MSLSAMYEEKSKRLSLKPGFVAFRDYFGRFSTSNFGDNIRKLILPPKFESKIGSKEPEDRQKLISTTVSKDLLSAFYAFLLRNIHEYSLVENRKNHLRTYPAKIFRRIFWIILAAFRFKSGGLYTLAILPSTFELKIGSKEPKNRLKLFSGIGSQISSQLFHPTLRIGS